MNFWKSMRNIILRYFYFDSQSHVEDPGTNIPRTQGLNLQLWVFVQRLASSLRGTYPEANNWTDVISCHVHFLPRIFSSLCCISSINKETCVRCLACPVFQISRRLPLNSFIFCNGGQHALSAVPLQLPPVWKLHDDIGPAMYEIKSNTTASIYSSETGSFYTPISLKSGVIWAWSSPK